MPKISLVIPSNHSSFLVSKLLLSVLDGNVLPSEVFIVVSGDGQLSLEIISPARSKFLKKNIPVYILIQQNSPLPGSSRNSGVEMAVGDYLCFLDVQTLPNPNWLESATTLLNNADVDGVWGSCYYEADSWFTSLLRDSIYGRNGIRSLPGTIFRRECYLTTGKMVSWVPSGEDVDWMHRVLIHKLNFVRAKDNNIIYTGLNNKSLLFFIKKWWKYYHNSRLLSINDRDRWLSNFFVYLIIIFTAFNWNYKISEYIFGVSFLVPHITKLVVIFAPIFYVIMRGIYLPLKRGVPIGQVLPFRFVSIAAIAFLLDMVKLIALFSPARITIAKIK